MEFTIFGFIWLLLLVLSLFRPISWTIFLLILSGIFQATAVINMTDKGFSPFLVSQIFFILRNLVSILDMDNKMVMPDKGYIYLLLFFIFSSIGIVLLPNLFDGIRVYSAELGIDLNYLRGGSSLKFGGNNIVQGFYLLLNVLCIYQLYKLRSVFLFKVGIRAFIFSSIIVVFFGLWEFIYKKLGIIYYPSSFISNNAGYSLIELEFEKGVSKINSTFIEPSYAGGYLAAGFWSFFFINKVWTKVFSFILFIVLCVNLSGTGFATFFIGGLVCLILFKRNYIIVVAFTSILLYFIVDYIGYSSFILDTLFNKSTSMSGIHRQGSNDFSLKVFLETFGFGVGLGSHRASSFLYTMIATSGVLAIFCFTYLFKLLFAIYKQSNLTKDNKDLSNSYSLIFRFGLVYLISQFLAIPDLSNPTFWTWQFVAFLGIYNSKEHFKQSSL